MAKPCSRPPRPQRPVPNDTHPEACRHGSQTRRSRLRCPDLFPKAGNTVRNGPLRHIGLDLSGRHACSVLARARRYAPVSSGTHSPVDSRIAVQSGRSRYYLTVSIQINRTEQRTLNPRVRGSSPWQRTWDDLGLYRPRVFFCVWFVPLFWPCSLRACSVVECWARVGLSKRTDWSRPAIGTPSDAATQREGTPKVHLPSGLPVPRPRSRTHPARRT
jgi:hypothetical protein